MNANAFVNRELSWLEFNRRVLEEAQDPSVPAAGAREVPGHLQLEPRRVLHGPRGRPQAAAPRRRADGGARRPERDRDAGAVSARVHELADEQHRCFLRGDPAAARRRGRRSSCGPRSSPASSSGSWRTTSAARSCRCSRRWPSIPGIHSRISAIARCAWWPRSGRRRPRPLPDSALAVIHIPSQVLPRFVAAARRPRPSTSSSCSRTSSACGCPVSTAATRSSPATRSGSPATPTCRSRGAGPRTCWPASRQSLRERRLGSAVRLQYDADLPPEILATLLEELELQPEDLYEGEGFTAFSDLLQLYAALDVPRLKDTPRPPHPVAGLRGRRRHLERHPRPRRARPSPVPRLRRGHPLRAGGGGRSPRAGHQDDALSRQPGLADRPRAAHGGGERQGGRGAGRAAGALRRGGQHPLGPRAGRSGRPRRVRPGRLQDALQGLPGGAPGARRHSPLLPRGHRQLQRAHRRRLRGPGAVHQPRVVRRGPDGPVQRAHRLHAPARLPPPAAGAHRPARPADRAHPERGRAAPGPAGRPASSPS